MNEAATRMMYQKCEEAVFGNKSILEIQSMMRQRVFMSEENEMNNLDSLRIQLANKEGQINQLEEHKEQLKQQLVEKEDKFDLPTINLK